jgi:hypothetical protein
MSRDWTFSGLALLAWAVASPAAAAPPPQSPLLGNLIKCEDVMEDAPRLACLDAATRAIREAAAAGRVALVDREKVEGARRSLFGFSLRGIPLFGEGDQAAEGPSELKSKVTSAREAGGGWLITLREGGTWATLEPLALTPRVGTDAVVRRNGFGGYMMKVAGRGVRVERRR